MFKPREQVVWSYRQRGGRASILVDAEVVHYGERRTCIRIRTTHVVLLRWVHPKNLRMKGAGEPAYPYPVSN